MQAVLMGEAARIGWLSLRRKLSGWKRYPGNVQSICDAILNDCWNGRFYQASAGHFRQFYARDIGIAAPFLDKERLRATMSYALERYAAHGKITTSITPGNDGAPFDFPVFGVDSLPFLLRGLRCANDKRIVSDHKEFLKIEIERWEAIVLNNDGFVKRNVHFSSMRDHAIRSSSCYDNAMVLLLKQEANALGLRTNVKLTAAKFIKEFWNGRFLNDERDKEVLGGDANVVPWWLGVVDDKKKAKTCLQALHELRMDLPIPLSYSESSTVAPKMIGHEFFVPSWERDGRWMQLGLMYVDVATKLKMPWADEVIASVRSNIERNQNVLEVFTPEGRPYTSAFYHADESMLWGAALAKKAF